MIEEVDDRRNDRFARKISMLASMTRRRDFETSGMVSYLPPVTRVAKSPSSQLWSSCIETFVLAASSSQPSV